MKILSVSLLAAALLAAGCASPQKRMDYLAVDSPAMKKTMGYSAWLPPGFGPGERLPLVVFLHGAGDDPRAFDRFHVGSFLDDALRDGLIPRAVIVVPQGDFGMWTNWYDGTRRYEDWVVDDLVRDATTRFHTLSCPEGCHLAGASMGGAGALRIALHHPDRFATVSSLSGMVMDRDEAISFSKRGRMRMLVPMERIFGPMKDREDLVAEDLFLRWRRPEDVHGMRIFLSWGNRDRKEIVASNERFAKHLADSGIPFSSEVYVGGHDWKDWKRQLVPLLRTQVGAPACGAADGQALPGPRPACQDPRHVESTRAD